MPALTARRPSLCLFCAFASRARRPPAHPQRLLPRTPVAYRSGGGSSASRRPSRDPHFSRSPRDRDRDGHAQGERPSQFNLLRQVGRPASIQTTIEERLEALRRSFIEPEFLESLNLTREAFDEEWASFTQYVKVWVRRDAPEVATLVRDATRGKAALDTRLRYLFYAQTCGGRFTKAEVENQKELADLRYPAEWYPATREIPRTVHLHVGPTNSGKTYHALKRLEEADKGIYLGPLRLLAHEVYTRLNAKGKPCALVTGEEQRLPDQEPKMWSCTVEMAPLNQKLDVAVIDEIQMINHAERGWAWTQAFLGIQAREMHLCGEARTVPLIRELCALTGDKVVVHEYERLTPLRVADRSLNGNLDRLEKGDCIVVFSVLGIHALRRQVETKTGRKCAIVYGSLPPETRAQQARLFNDPDNEYDFLIASDAIGMGLNLSIKRVIFESTMKNNGKALVPLQISEVKQIAGRAGRYKTAHQAIAQDTAKESSTEPVGDPSIEIDDGQSAALARPVAASDKTVGYATTLEPLDFRYLKSCMEKEPEAIKTAGIFPPSLIVERFANYFPPGTPFSYIMLRLHELSNIHPRFHLCALKDQLAIADVIHPIKNLSIQERIIICSAPTNVKDDGERKFLHALARCIAENESGELLDLPHLPLEYIDSEPSEKRAYLYQLEQLHKMLILYLWLSFRFPNVFTTRGLANYAKKLVEDKIEDTLSRFSFTRKTASALKRKRMEAMRELEESAVSTEKSSDTLNAAGKFVNPEEDGMTQEARDILNDEQSFASDSKTDDAKEYPTPELEIELSDTEEGSSPDTVGKLDIDAHKKVQGLSRDGKDVKGGQLPTNVNITPNRIDAPQPRA